MVAATCSWSRPSSLESYFPWDRIPVSLYTHVSYPTRIDCTVTASLKSEWNLRKPPKDMRRKSEEKNAIRYTLHCQRVLAIPSKRYERGPVEFLTEEETAALVGSPNPDTWIGRRDKALLLVAVQ